MIFRENQQMLTVNKQGDSTLFDILKSIMSYVT